jgi:hypothetical protein
VLHWPVADSDGVDDGNVVGGRRRRRKVRSSLTAREPEARRHPQVGVVSCSRFAFPWLQVNYAESDDDDAAGTSIGSQDSDEDTQPESDGDGDWGEGDDDDDDDRPRKKKATPKKVSRGG